MSTDQQARRAAPADAEPGRVRPRRRVSAGDVVFRQVQAIDAWNSARSAREAEIVALGGSRLEREAAGRELDVLRRVRQAIATQVAASLAGDSAPFVVAAPSAVVAHRHDWSAQKISELLRAQGIAVLTCTRNGAEALGVVIAEQPDILITCDRLEMMSGDSLLDQASRYSPGTVRGAQVNEQPPSERWHSLADVVFRRADPPADMVDTLLGMTFASSPTS